MDKKNRHGVNRRMFIKTISSGMAGTMALGMRVQEPEEEVKVREYRLLGRTGFKACDISMGGTRNREPNVFRYAYDKGVNYFDTAEGYVNGQSEKYLGEVLKHMQRDKIFITTKLHISAEETVDDILERFRKCQERLQTKYVDALYMHNPDSVELLNHQGFHEAVARLKSEGRLRFRGLSSHGPRRRSGESMETILTAAAEDGRFDLMLLVYSFMNYEAGDKVLAACRKNNVGATAMKVSPGVIKVDDFNPDQPTEEQAAYLESQEERGVSRERAVERMNNRINRRKENMKNSEPFVRKHGIKTEDELKITSIRWVLKNKDMHSVCVSFSEFDHVDKILAISGSPLSSTEDRQLKRYGMGIDSGYCRHACHDCAGACPHGIPVSTIMRYASYYHHQNREREAMDKYRRLGHTADASQCASCSAPCSGACPYDHDIQLSMMQAHRTLNIV